MPYREAKPAFRRNDNILNFTQPSPPQAASARALDLVYQAADVFNGIEVNARRIEARAQDMCKGAAQKLRYAEQRVAEAETALQDVIAETERKLGDAVKALTQAELRITAAEDIAATAEMRAHVAEAESHEAKRTLELVEEAIRRRLLCSNSDDSYKFRNVV